MRVVDPIHCEGGPGLRPGRYITVLEMPPVSVFSGIIDETTEVPQHTLCGIVMKVLAVQVPYISCVTWAQHGNMPPDARITVDMRRYKLGFISPDYARRIKRHDQSAKRLQRPAIQPDSL
jgi:hypothetical protein